MQLHFLLCFVVAAVSASRTFKGDQVLRVIPVREDQIKSLEHLVTKFELDLWTDIRGENRPVDIHVLAKDITAFKVALRRLRIDFTVFIDDVQALVENERAPRLPTRSYADFDYEVYHNYEEIQQWITSAAEAYPSIATAATVGSTFEGREFKALTISSQPGNPQFVINCGIHAREWVTPATCMFSAKYLLDGYGNDATITSLVNQVDFVFIPSSNPDGYAYTWSSDRMWRKTRTKRSGVCVGVDPNRNFDAQSLTSPCSDTYCGPSAFSEVETKLILEDSQKNFVESLPNPVMYVDVHAYSQLWMFPYGYTTSRPADFMTLTNIASDSVSAIQATHGAVYEPGQISTTIYVASGSTADYFYDTTGIKCSFATELRDTGRYGFLLPERLIKPTAEESFAAFKVMAQAIVDGKC
uniref:Peptidase M14 domain-containing protein n=1 Tax=Ciona savignyi TaxID=51511 RepID=H2Z538_CIOSA